MTFTWTYPNKSIHIKMVDGLQDGQHCIKGEAHGPALGLHVI